MPIIVLLAFVGNACTSVGGEARDWAFIQGVGGLAIHQPYRMSGSVFIPVDCNVSGIRAITVNPNLVNSGIVVKGVKAVHHNSTIYVQVFTTVAHGDEMSAACTPAKLANIPPGKYDVVYGMPMPSNELGKSNGKWRQSRCG